MLATACTGSKWEYPSIHGTTLSGQLASLADEAPSSAVDACNVVESVKGGVTGYPGGSTTSCNSHMLPEHQWHARLQAAYVPAAHVQA